MAEAKKPAFARLACPAAQTQIERTRGRELAGAHPSSDRVQCINTVVRYCTERGAAPGRALLELRQQRCLCTNGITASVTTNAATTKPTLLINAQRRQRRKQGNDHHIVASARVQKQAT